jgi:hypothetical protein
MKTSGAAKKSKAILVRLSTIEHRRVALEAARRGLTVADLTRTALRSAYSESASRRNDS